MTLEALTDLDVAFGWDNPDTAVADLKSVLTELQGLTISITSGDCNANVNMAVVPAILTTDTIIAAFEVSYPGASTASGFIDRTSVVSCTSSGYVQSTVGLAAQSTLLLFWYNKD